MSVRRILDSQIAVSGVKTLLVDFNVLVQTATNLRTMEKCVKVRFKLKNTNEKVKAKFTKIYTVDFSS